VADLTCSGTPTQALVTGQKGAGKTTELKRVVERLRQQSVFVSFEDGSFVEALGSDVTASDILYFAAERLVVDLTDREITSAGTAWRGFWETLRNNLDKLGVELNGPLGVGIGLSLRDEPTRRSELRRLLDANRNRFVDMVNREIIRPAVDRLKERSLQGITLVMDGLGDIPWRTVEDPLLATRTNHEQIFIEQGDILAGLACDVIYTFPIELAYQGLRLGNQAGGEAMELGIIPIVQRSGTPDAKGRAALRTMLERRAARCESLLADLLTDDDIDHLIDVSGGHIRTLFELVQAAINRVAPGSPLPIGRRMLDNAVIRRADTMQKGLLEVHREVLVHVRAHRSPPPDSLRPRFTELLFSQHVLAYYDQRGTWYAAHPLTDPAMLA
jgi:hypothetical protein